MYIKIDTFCPSSRGEHPVLGWMITPEDPSWVVHPWENEPQPEAANWYTQMLEDTNHVSSGTFQGLLSFPCEEMAPCCVSHFPLSTFQFFKCQHFFLVTPQSLGDLSSLTKDWTWGPRNESVKSQPLDHQEIPPQGKWWENSLKIMSPRWNQCSPWDLTSSGHSKALSHTIHFCSSP